MALQLITNQRQIFFDALNGNQLIGKDLHGGIDHIAEHDGLELAFTPGHQFAPSALSCCLRP